MNFALMIRDAQVNAYEKGYKKGYMDGFITGYAHGYKNGVKERCKEVAKNMLKDNCPINEIVRILKLDEAEINNLKNTIQQ